MIEIRPIREAEANRFLQVLCDVFDLDLNRARGVFFHEPLFDLKRKWALFEGAEMSSILTTVPLEFGWGPAIGIAGVATLPHRRGSGLAGDLLRRVLEVSESKGEGAVLLFAKDAAVYQRCGFEVIDEVIRGPILAEPEPKLDEILALPEIQTRYSAWASRDPSRLRRDERRWNFWKWNLRVCTPFNDGYICHEGAQIRECVTFERPLNWKLPPESEWMGLRSMSVNLDLPLGVTASDLWLLGYRVPGIPQMFMTDQF